MAERADAFVFFGATGDLAFKQIFPALQEMVVNGTLEVPIVGVALSGANWTVEDLRKRAHDSLAAHGPVDETAFAKLSGLLRYVDGNYDDPATFAALRRELGDAKYLVHYLAVPPALFGTVAKGLAGANCVEDARIVIEKPFGHDQASAQALDAVLHEFFPEDNVYRLDHFLGKDSVENIVYLRFANPLFEPIWNRNYVDSIQITMAEDFDVADRAAFYDAVGTIRDVFQNHLLAVISNLCMEPPSEGSPSSARDARATLMKAVRPLAATDIVRGQYAGYQDHEGVRQNSTTETFVAVRLFIDNWRWAGVPIYVRSGKCLPETATEITVRFKRPPHVVFDEVVSPDSSHLRMRISPDISIGLGVRVKRLGDDIVGEDVELALVEQAAHALPPYVRLLGDALKGDDQLFSRSDLIDAEWRVVDGVLGQGTPVYPYEKGAWGPDVAGAIIGEHGPWITPFITKSDTKGSPEKAKS